MHVGDSDDVEGIQHYWIPVSRSHPVWKRADPKKLSLRSFYVPMAWETTDGENGGSKRSVVRKKRGLKDRFSRRPSTYDSVQFFSVDACSPKLDLRKTLIRFVPPAVEGMSYLEILLLDSNLLTDLPSFLGNLRDLTELGLAENQIADLPEELCLLENLKKLDARGNNVRDLPRGITELKKLRQLLMGNNDLRSLPENLNGMRSLRKLDVSFNRLTEIPESVGMCTFLREILANDNLLKGIPASLTMLPFLQVANFERNPLTDPSSLSRMTFLSHNLSPSCRKSVKEVFF